MPQRKPTPEREQPWVSIVRFLSILISIVSLLPGERVEVAKGRRRFVWCSTSVVSLPGDGNRQLGDINYRIGTGTLPCLPTTTTAMVWISVCIHNTDFDVIPKAGIAGTRSLRGRRPRPWNGTKCGRLIKLSSFSAPTNNGLGSMQRDVGGRSRWDSDKIAETVRWIQQNLFCWLINRSSKIRNVLVNLLTPKVTHNFNLEKNCHQVKSSSN